MPNLRVLEVRENGLGNDEDDDLSFLYTLSNSSKLEVLDLTMNNFGGELPGVFCSEKFPRERMDISSAVAELNRTKANFLGRRG
ncbi:hypothetical protein DKX38_027528 [Salix brachista]|uniref:FBD domain-containing protein n=1 Tax=Salix brachista TaxID=2182728 RepID=A0A5N5JGA3_9ROSI|nr:hypothetical protein DKX38_027528 [Salix brachista]